MSSIPEQIMKFFSSKGVKYVFGIPGGPSIPYIEAMRTNGIEFVLVANEQSAAIMADVFGRLTGMPGVCHATFGPGATNLSTGIGGAYLDRSPLVALTTEVNNEYIGRKYQMNIDHQALFKPITKWTTRLSHKNCMTTLSKAFSLAASEVPGPVHLGLPIGLEEEFAQDDIYISKETGLIAPDEKDINNAVAFIQKAKKPIIVIGLTATRHCFYHAVRRFINKHNIPVVLTPMAKGIISPEHPNYVGVVFHAQSEYAANIYRESDLVIGIGYDPVEFNYETWMPNVPLIHIDTEPADISPAFNVVQNVVGDIAETLKLIDRHNLPVFDWDLTFLQANKCKMFEALNPTKRESFTPSDAIKTLREVFPKNGILTSDVGAHLHLLGQLWKVEEPNEFIITNGWSSMGFGIPSAIGAKLCMPEKTVVCITGDGGFLMNCGEILTARRLGLNVVIIVFCDSKLSLIELKQDRKKTPRYGTVLYEGEYFKADSFFGAPVLKVRDANQMKESLLKAFSMNGPVILETVIDGAVYNSLVAKNYK
ncbi:MAG: thiamine pyrophosphate-binding protein [Peptococcaceae bacterium]|jgi:acetolactate synthase-1/2/3 large subunit|nr:thiamine pyrophosphate-binding protein [Peptococcaceae bacterium]MDH7526055.1 thiamine pyrophosphate-binding protein [Peptococcaceae bacterium]